MTAIDPTALERGIRESDRRAVARAITLVESSHPDHQPAAAGLLEKLARSPGHALRIGLSGAPGVGKSTFIESFGTFLTGRGRKVAVLAVDPSSTVGGGSILGDKTRMERLARDPGAFIRPTPSGSVRGGVARRTPEAIRIVEAAGFDVVIVETVGVGQSEAAVAAMTDVFVLLLAPGAGDELQGIKRGIVELAHLVLVNKADGDLAAAAQRTAAEYRNALQLLAGSDAGWRVEVHTCSALTGSGIAEVWGCIERYRDWYEATGARSRRRSGQAREWLWSEIAESVRVAVGSREDLRRLVESLEGDVAAGRAPAAAAARRIVAAALETAEGFGERTEGADAMIGRLNHVAIAVPDLGAARATYRDTLGARVSEPVDLPEHGVTTVFVDLPNARIELLGVLGESSPIAGFLERNPGGGIHHVCYEVGDIEAARAQLEARGARVLGDGRPKIGAHGRPVLFLHPKDFCGTLVEIEQS